MDGMFINNIAFAKGGPHLPIAHALHPPKPVIIFGGGEIFLAFILGGWDFFLVRGIFLGWGIFFWAAGVPYPIFFCTHLLVRVKLGYPPNFNFIGKPVLGEK